MENKIATKEFIESLGWKCIQEGKKPYWMYTFGKDLQHNSEDEYCLYMTIWGLSQKSYRIEISEGFEGQYYYQSQKDIPLTEEKLKQIIEDVVK